MDQQTFIMPTRTKAVSEARGALPTILRELADTIAAAQAASVHDPRELQINRVIVTYDRRTADSAGGVSCWRVTTDVVRWTTAATGAAAELAARDARQLSRDRLEALQRGECPECWGQGGRIGDDENGEQGDWQVCGGCDGTGKAPAGVAQ